MYIVETQIVEPEMSIKFARLAYVLNKILQM